MNLVIREIQHEGHRQGGIVHVFGAEHKARRFPGMTVGFVVILITFHTRSFRRPSARVIGTSEVEHVISEHSACTKEKPQYVGSGLMAIVSLGYPRKTLSWRLIGAIVPRANRVTRLNLAVRAFSSLYMEGAYERFVK